VTPALVELHHDRWMYRSLHDLVRRYESPNNLLKHAYTMVNRGTPLLVLNTLIEQPLGGKHSTTMPTTCIYMVCTPSGNVGYIELTILASNIKHPVSELGKQVQE
jgi:hypothetical protein